MTIGHVNQAETAQALYDRLIRLNQFMAMPMKRSKTHDYTKAICGSEYAFEAADLSGSKGYMTGQQRGVKQNDHIVLKQGNTPVQYRVETIEYYSSPSDMWIALLVRVD